MVSPASRLEASGNDVVHREVRVVCPNLARIGAFGWRDEIGVVAVGSARIDGGALTFKLGRKLQVIVNIPAYKQNWFKPSRLEHKCAYEKI